MPTAAGTLEPYTLRPPVTWARPEGPPAARIAFAAAHVVAQPSAANAPGAPAVLDWDATLRFRRHLWAHGFRVADAMDTAQRGMGLNWAATEELIARSGAAAAELGDPFTLLACGAGTDNAPDAASLDAIVDAYRAQIHEIRSAGAQVIVMASRRLAALATGPGDYRTVYDRLLAEADRPVILHWLGEMFDPALAGYWGSGDRDKATGHFLDLIEAHADKVDGVKVSLLDADHEVRLRATLPAGVKLYTGDDFHYPELIASGSHALLGIFDAIAPAAAAALAALDAGDLDRYHAILAPTVVLSRKIFEAPTFHYKTGVVFLAWLAGHQDGFAMVGGAQSARSLPHLAEVFRLADRAGLLPDPELAEARMARLLAVHGVGV
ncbi:dihydrodipicolinate synthase family protein [Nocardia panacis]|uniref:Dihydrodipicolinate synthase family protein n=1 Tax=Nocardia panacis TaxID=2340916 RepID=A0A3A4KTV5_9NOCA|nr:dihydrodipicolinate synthase family protein [Nocardia panacis]